MHRRPSRLTALWVVAAALFAGCNKEAINDPRIVSLELVSGMNQSGFVGGLLTNPLVVRAQDQDGEPVSGIQIAWTVTGGGLATPSSGVSDADGLTSTSYRLGGTVGTQTVTAIINGDDQGVTFSATATPAPASMIAITSGDDQTGVVRTQLPVDLTVKVTDAFGNAKEGTTVFFTVVLGSGTVSSPTAVSDPNGLAKVKWTLGPLASTQRVAAQIPGVVPAIFDATATPAAPALITIVSGNYQSASPGVVLPDSLVIRVTDPYENPIRDVSVTWTTTGQAGTVSPSTGKTDAVGRLAASWTLGSGSGPKEARATSGGLPPAVFQAAGTIVFRSIMAGGHHSCALDQDGVAYCWGFNDAGQLGTGSVTPGNGPVLANLFPNTVAGGHTFALGNSGSSHSCAVTLSNIAYCWGLNFDGRVGNGQTGSPVPTPAGVSGSNVFKAVSTGDTHSCGLTAGDRLFCWGSNAEGKIGVGPAAGPFAIPQAVAPTTTFGSVAAGSLHTCAVSLGGVLYCWGSDAQGQSGLGGVGSVDMPTPVPGEAYAQVVAGESHTCALDIGGDVYCWGDNEFGQLGDGTTEDHLAPAPGGGGLKFQSLTAGRYHTCGLTSSGVAYCWGRGSKGQLGNDAFDSEAGPVPVGGGLTFASLSAGGLHTCGVTTGNVAWCWGDNQFGALGDGTQVSSALPVRVAFQP